jgi:hypothetical protein
MSDRHDSLFSAVRAARRIFLPAGGHGACFSISLEKSFHFHYNDFISAGKCSGTGKRVE